MQPLYTEDEFRTAKSRQLLPLQCVNCTKTFYRPKNFIQKVIAGVQGFAGKFCCKQCQHAFQDERISVPCTQCGQPIIVSTSKGNHFCNHSCAAKWSNAHKTKGTRVSKLEVWLQNQLLFLYPEIEFHFNRKDAINSELDIFIPSLRLAFELNGIFHYEPIYGPEKLASIQNNDTRKSQACLEHGIALCFIDTSSQKYFKEQSAMKFLQIIQNIISNMG